MTFKATIWYPIAVALTAINLVGVGLAVVPGESWHAAIHAALALAFGLWAQRLRQGSGASALEVPHEALAALDADLSKLRQEVGELHERLDFVERLLAQGPEPRRVGPQP